MTKQLWSIFVTAMLVALIVKTTLQADRIKALESKVAVCEATDEVFWQRIGEMYRLQASLR